MRASTILCPTHVGRDEEIAAINAAAASVASRRAGQALLIAGEAGVGKSRLVAETQRAAADRGLAVLVGQCVLDAAAPYSPFVTALRRRTRLLDTAELAGLFEGSALLSASLLPEAARVVDLPTGLTPSADDLFAATWQLLRRLVGDAGGVLILEDLHWADPDSLRLLAYLMRELADLPVLLVGTYRPDELHRRHPLTATLADLSRERRYDEIKLQPLDREATRAMLSAIFDGTEVGDEFVDAVHARAGGNPFFLEEVAKVLVERGDIYREGADWSRRDIADIEIPDTVRETLLARCRDLGPDAIRVLQLAAMSGDRLDLRVLARAADLPLGTVEDVVRHLLDLQLLAERADGYEFRHALTREAFADELVGPDRRQAHLLIAEAVLAEHPHAIDDAAAELADHFAQAGEPERAVDFALAAARRAARAHAYEEAARRYEQAIALLSRRDPRRLELLLEAADGTFANNDRRASVAFATEARSLARELNDPVAEARALFPIDADRWHSGDTAGAISVMRESLALVQGRDDWHEAWVLRRLSRLLVLADQRDEAIPLIERGIEVATRVEHFAALSGLYGTRAMRLSFGDAAWAEAIDAAIKYARRSADADALGNILNNAGFMNLWCGALDRAQLAFAEVTELYDRTRPSDKYAAAGYAWALSLRGDYENAMDLAAPLRDYPDTPSQIVALCALTEVAERTGWLDLEQIVDRQMELANVTGESQRLVPATAARARYAARTGPAVDADPLFTDVLRRTRTHDGKGSHWMFSPDFAALLSAEGDVDRLSAWVGEIEELTANDHTPFNDAAAELCRAHLAAATGDAERARSRFRAAAAAYQELPCPARAVEALLGLAAVELRAGNLDDSRGAAQRGRDLAARIGAKVLVAEAETAIERASARPVLATVLFTDIVGSTERAAALGDSAWRAVLERHHALVRRELSATGGREIDTAGDGFLAAFDSPAQAIRCATSIRESLKRIGLDVRVGIHTGECQATDGKLTGLAVHIAARVNASAGAGEVLVSGTVRDLLAGSGFAFEDRGAHQLKGVPGEWRLFAVPG